MATTPKQKFDAAVKVIHSLPKDGPFQPSYEMMLNFYAYYKQATEGVCKKTKPWAWDIVNKKKWDAWTKLGDLPREDAMLKYVEELKKIVEAMPQSDDVREFMEKLGSFYEIVDEESPVHAAAKEHATEEQVNMITGGNDITALDIDSAENFNHSVMVESVLNRNGLTNGEIDEEEENIDDELHHIEQNETDSRTTSSGDIETITNDGGNVVADGGQLPAIDTDSEEEFCDTSDRPSQDNSGDEIDADVALSISTPLKSTPHKGVVSEPTSRVKRVTELQSMSPITKQVIAQKGNTSESNNISFPNLDSRNEIGDSLLVHGPGEVTLNFYSENGITDSSLGDLDNEISEHLNISSLKNNLAQKHGGGDMSPPGGSTDRQGQRSYGGTYSSMAGHGSSEAASRQTVGGVRSQQTGTVNEHILIAIDRLHQDMNNIQSRLNALEAKQKSTQGKDNSSWASMLRSLPRGKSLFFIVVWPLIIHWILLKIFHRRRNRPS